MISRASPARSEIEQDRYLVKSRAGCECGIAGVSECREGGECGLGLIEREFEAGGGEDRLAAIGRGRVAA